MPYIRTKDPISAEKLSLYYEDYGRGQPIVLIHGWPLSHEMWEYQVGPLVEAGFRVISYDRRGFGKSSKPWNGYDYDTLTDDLKSVLEELDLNDVTLVGFSMGGGEVARYFSRHGGERVSQAVLISAVTPFMLKTKNNPDGLPKAMFDEIGEKIKDDRIAFLDGFGKQFYGVNVISHPVSEPYLENDIRLAAIASPRATLACATSFSETDFREDLKAIHVPTLIIHGDADKTVPIEVGGRRTAQLVKNSQLIEYVGAPHGLFYTEKDRLNDDLIGFLKLEEVKNQTAKLSSAKK